MIPKTPANLRSAYGMALESAGLQGAIQNINSLLDETHQAKFKEYYPSAAAFKIFKERFAHTRFSTMEKLEWTFDGDILALDPGYDQRIKEYFVDVFSSAIIAVEIDEEMQSVKSNRKDSETAGGLDTKEPLQSYVAQEKALYGKGLSGLARIRLFLDGYYGAYSDGATTCDLLGYADYAKALVDVITNKDTGTPISVGICAPWGRGKTTLLGLMKDLIESSRSKQSCRNQSAFRTARAITFDAWKYSKADQIWAGFIDVILNEIDKGLGRRERWALAYRLNKSADLPFIRRMIFAFILLLIITIMTLIIPFGWLQPILPSENLVSYLPMLPPGIAVLMILHRLYVKGGWKLISSPITERVLSVARLPDYSQRLDPIHKIVRDIRLASKLFKEKNKIDRFVVFIDDIDRCHPKDILAVLESIKHFLEIEGFVFVIAMDPEIVRMAVGNQFKFMCTKPDEIEEMGNYYLEKMIQIPFHLPEINPMLRESMINHILQDHIPSAESPLDTGTNGPVKTVPSQTIPPIEPFLDDDLAGPLNISLPERDRMLENMKIPELKISPRLIKRYMNTYLIARHLLITRSKKTPELFEGKGPTNAFIDWMLLNAIYPRECAALLKWFISSNWDVNPLDGSIFNYGQSYSTDHDLANQRVFKGMLQERLNVFGRIYKIMELHPMQLKYCKDIISCFNLYLD